MTSKLILVKKNGPKIGPKNSPKIGPMVQRSNGPVHILPYATFTRDIRLVNQSGGFRFSTNQQTIYR